MNTITDYEISQLPPPPIAWTLFSSEEFKTDLRIKKDFSLKNAPCVERSLYKKMQKATSIEEVKKYLNEVDSRNRLNRNEERVFYMLFYERYSEFK
tara:strand:- start:1042 stop:1329 length:288 start_codon:yes stop_codon:yes gene_type:complete